MTLAVLKSCAIAGMHAPEVRVEVHVAPGLPAFNIVGLPGTGVKESRERVRSALFSSGYQFPAGRLTANLSPADLPKDSGRFDLPIALGVLLASGQITMPAEQAVTVLSKTVFAGELSLTGTLIPVAAPLVIGLSVYRQKIKNAVLVLPKENAAVAAHIQGLNVLGASTLKEVADFLAGTANPKYETARAIASKEKMDYPCLSDIKGQPIACRALEIAASGGHGLLMSGSPGVGKSMLAQRLPGLLPALSSQQLLEVTAVQSLSQREMRMSMQRPFRSPHHSASMVSLIGGGAQAKPGEISMAHHGVLFLDELPEFDRKALESLREPMEKGEICITRSSRSVVYPAQFQLISAMNPCPCGYLGHASKPCVCSPEKINRYQGKLSGPLLDRIDMQITVHPFRGDWETAQAAEPSVLVKERVARCQALQQARQGKLNAHLDAGDMGQYCQLDSVSNKLIQQACNRFSWSVRVMHRVLRVARTIADMTGKEAIDSAALSEAISYRQQMD
ncbi:YifB family Mg chelatase-like AAA ATPase [Advenella sp. WQ 585]|uniref:YifB family Mg chelatase-like AAA ATPase n=1 Tax=Advenella mandrilli TaxID=2800330 RepID=A0ABS1EGN3_9BURK|nr:YifB family Mg chelatase-like AAA ATPase [Advenella mandrilli]MBK1782172.1 YifB family Mg chelatase-like AAA ATPase [Advenella mandrilli]